MIEPESVYHDLCPKAKDDDGMGGVNVPQMLRRGRLDDEAGIQIGYVCPACGTVISMNFPPEKK